MLSGLSRERALDNAPGMELRTVPLPSVMPHEIADPRRLDRIERRLSQDGVLRDPIIVGRVPDVEGYVLLDGTNRTEALGRLGAHLVMAQILDYADQHAVSLRSWCHAAYHSIDAIVERAGQIPGITIEVLPPLAAVDALHDSGTLAVLLDAHNRYLLLHDMASNRAEQLRDLVSFYENRMAREDCTPQSIEEQAKTLAAAGEPVTLVGFPRFTRAQVVGMAINRTPIPAGITRHTINTGRALRINLPLNVLHGADDVEANDILQHHLESLNPRVYREPTILFDS
ncbi:MAG TPA: ParB N-terminal domain-containing protein [Chloroflexota bacterium]|nr:ParB N-terminal domain-containing protein [Chloroflexota bacterium]